MELRIQVIGADGEIRHARAGAGEVFLGWRGRYEEGDRLVVECDAPVVRLVIQLDECLAPSHVLLRGGCFEFPVPFGSAKKSYGADSAFAGERHLCRVRVEDAREASSWKNLALNSHDLTPGEGVLTGSARDLPPVLFPHASTNAEPNNPQFIARNAIDGVVATERHGSWPHGSWGVAGRDDAWLRVDFGGPVVADELRIYLRAEFPHDTCWRSADVELSDGSVLSLRLRKTGDRQAFDLGGSRIEWLRLTRLKKEADEGFPGLSQLEVWGRRV